MQPGLSKDGSVHVTDEHYNTWISAVGAVLTLFGVAHLLWRSYTMGSPLRVVSFVVYGVGVLSVFVTSALHHGVDGSPRTNYILRQLDYCAIFLMIAGTFTPFCLLLVKGSLGTNTLALIWALAVTGIASKAFFPGLPRWAMVAVTIAMGWLGVVLIKPVYEAIHTAGIVGLLVGGLFFTVGGIIFGLEKPNPVPGKFGFHEIWHCCVVAGAASHFAVMYLCL
jgi:hemolysin III